MGDRKARDGERAQGGRRRLLLAATAAAGVIALIVVGVVLGTGQGPATAQAVAAEGAVSFAGTDPITGTRVSTASYAGKPLIVNIWASWCHGCNDEAAELKRFADAHPEAQLIGINFQDSKEGAKGFYDRWDWDYPSVYDPQGELAFQFGLQGTPTTLFLDKEHRIVARIVGATSESGFEQGLLRALPTA